MDQNQINEKEFLEKVEQAARKGARSAGRRGSIVSVVIIVLLIAGVALHFSNSLDDFKQKLSQFITTEDPVEGHDLTLENHKIFGYTAADFSEAVLGDTRQLKKIEVYMAEVSDMGTITDAGLAKLKVFSKTKIITYHGTAIYTVDLAKLSSDDFKLDEDTKTITLYIPHAQRGKINVPREEIEFGSTDKGVLAFGDIKMTPEDEAKVEAEAVSKMEQKLEESGESEKADEFAKMSVWSMYQPIISSVSPEYLLEVKFRD